MAGSIQKFGGLTPQMSPYWTQVLLGPAGFNERGFASNPDSRQISRWGHFMYRRLRYEVYWAHYEQNVYRSINLWAERLKESYQLYSAVRSIFSPAYRIGEFWAEHIYGGILDPGAGDGVGRFTSIPVLTKNAALRGAIAKVWDWSDWATNKDTWTRNGSVLGDTCLQVVDDPVKRQVYLKVIHPRIVRDYFPDARGYSKGYVFEEQRPDPRWEEPLGWPPFVTYSEVCTRVGDRVRFQTFLEGAPYDWHDYEDGDPDAGTVFDWTEDYGFVPFVFTQHRNFGQGWGWSELHATVSKLMELDDVASKLDDQIRKLVDCPWLFSGVPDPANGPSDDPNDPTLTVHYKVATDDSPEPERTSFPALYASDPAAKAQSLVAPLDVAAVSAHVLRILDEVVRDHPEVQEDNVNVAGDASGRARRVSREKTEARVVARRAVYDAALKRATQMAVSIAAMKGYPGFDAFDAGSYDRGDLDFSVGDRPVFAVDTLDHLEEAQGRATVLQTMVAAGVPYPVAMLQAGYPEAVVRQAVLYAAHAAAAGQPAPAPKTNVKGTPTTVVQADPANKTPAPPTTVPAADPAEALAVLFGTGAKL